MGRRFLSSEKASAIFLLFFPGVEEEEKELLRFPGRVVQPLPISPDL